MRAARLGAVLALVSAGAFAPTAGMGGLEPLPPDGRRAAQGPVTPLARTALVGDEETGPASWYGNPYHGRRTANGEVYDTMQLTAVHRTLRLRVVSPRPFPT